MNFLLLLSVFLAFCGVTIVYGYPDPYSGGVVSSKPGNCAATVTAFPTDPSTECCGVVSSAPKLLSGPSAFIDQHPWSAQIEYLRNGSLMTMCNGALISGKYILTGAHCVTRPESERLKPENIILGEYDTSNEGKDCITVESGGEDCTDGAVRIPIEKIIVHPEFSRSDKSYKNDIALIRMKQMAPYTDFIRPICLPTEDITLKTGAIYFNKASFASMDIISKRSPILLKVTVPFVTKDQCEPHFNRRNINLSKGQICAGGNETKDFCRGDGGVPLEYDNGRFNEAIGLVSFGPRCGQNLPTIYTNIYEYNSWIKSNIVE